MIDTSETHNETQATQQLEVTKDPDAPPTPDMAFKPNVEMPLCCIVVAPFIFPRIPDEHIPISVRKDIDEDWKLKSAELQESQKIPITVLRNRSRLEVKDIIIMTTSDRFLANFIPS